VYSIQHYMIKFVSHLRQVGGFLLVLWFPPPKSGVKHQNTTISNKIKFNFIMANFCLSVLLYYLLFKGFFLHVFFLVKNYFCNSLVGFESYFSPWHVSYRKFQLKDKISIYKLSKLTMSNNISFVFLKSNFLLPDKTWYLSVVIRFCSEISNV
jgi:hypothetical protein